MRSLREIREQSHAIAHAAVERGARAAHDQLTAAWAIRAAANLGGGARVAFGYAEADAAIGRLFGPAPTDEDRFQARHHLTIYIKLTALPVEAGGFGAEAVLDQLSPSGGPVTTGP